MLQLKYSIRFKTVLKQKEYPLNTAMDLQQRPSKINMNAILYINQIF